MKQIIVAACVSIILTACGTAGRDVGLHPSKDTVTPVKDVKLSTDFRDEGIKIYYTLTGAVDRIEVAGIAPAWRGNVEIIAEADAMDKLVKFVHGQTAATERRNRIITKTLDRARDNTLNQFRTVDGTLNFDSREVAKSIESDSATGVPTARQDSEGREQANTSRRIADRIEQGLVEATTSITAQGRLSAVRKIRDQVIQDGRLYVAIYQWSPRDQDASDYARSRMR